jgi:hyperosmotically inducible periplasmic protein
MKITPLLSVFGASLFFLGCSSTPAQTDTNMYSGTADTNSSRTYSASSTNYSTNNVDNSGINRRDQNNTNLSALDQGNSQTDIRLSANIRRQVVASTNNFSVAAHNVKIITQNGKVTLRGPVNTDQEKTQIGAIANNVAGEGNVDNQLEVKSNQ